MQSKDESSFAVIMITTGEAYGIEISKGMVSIYWEALKDLDVDDIRQAFSMAIKELKFFPKVADIRGFSSITPKDRPILAFYQLLDTIRRYGPWETVVFEDKAIMKAVEYLGGWECVCAMSKKEIGFMEKDFIELYRALSNSTQGTTELLIGAFDRINSDNPGHRKSGWNKTVLIPDVWQKKKMIGNREVIQIKGSDPKSDD